MRRAGFVFSLLLLLAVPYGRLSAQALSWLRPTSVYGSAMPVWLYNGFTEDEDGNAVQGSDISPIRISFGVGVEIELSEQGSLQPELWFYLQEYIALDAYDKTVPTQIETGSAVGDIANTLSLALEIPWVYTLTFPDAPDWSVSGRGGLALVFRIPVAGVDGSDAGPVAGYWIAGRFLYPYIGVGADYRFTDRMEIGAGVSWYVPVYNLWDGGEQTGFLDETMLRYGLTVRYRLES